MHKLGYGRLMQFDASYTCHKWVWIRRFEHMSFDRSFRISIPAEQGARRLISFPCQWSYGNQLEENWDAKSLNCATCFWMATWLSREPSRRKHEFSFHLISSPPFGVFLSVCVCDRIFNTVHMVSRTDINIRSRNTQTLLVGAMRLEAWVLIKTSAAQLRTGYNNPQLTITINPIVSPFVDQLVYPSMGPLPAAWWSTNRYWFISNNAQNLWV